MFSSVPRSGGNVGGTYRCEANDGTNRVTAEANIVIQTKPIITTGLPTAEVKKSSGEFSEGFMYIGCTDKLSAGKIKVVMSDK